MLTMGYSSIIFYTVTVAISCSLRPIDTFTAKQITIKLPKEQTPDDGWYSYTGLRSFGYSVGNATYFEFLVKTCSGAHVALMSGPTDMYTPYEVVISGQDNSETVVRKYKGGAAMIKSNGGMLDCSEFRAFRIYWEGGMISLVRKCRLGKWLKILSWKDSDPRPVKYIGVTTGWWASSTWTFNLNSDQDQESRQVLQFETTQQTGPNYHYTHLTDYLYELGQHTSIAFSVKACSDIYVALLSRNSGVCAMYEVLIGGYGNTLSVIRRGKNRYNSVTRQTSPADCNSFKSFIVTWPIGVLTVWYQSEVGVWQPLMSWRDHTPIDVRYIGMTTGMVTSGTWKVKV